MTNRQILATRLGGAFLAAGVALLVAVVPAAAQPTEPTTTNPATTTTTTAPSTSDTSVTATTTEPPTTTTTTTTGVAETAGVAAPKVAAAQQQQQQTVADTVVLAEGHCDVAARLIDGALKIQIGDDSTGTHRFLDVAKTVFHVRPAAEIEVPDDPNFAFLGSAGSKVWILPQDQQAGLLWPGWNTQEIPAVDVNGPVNWRLTGVEGPGDFWLFLVGALGDASILFNSADGLPDTVPVPAATHAHGNWGFNKEGVYRLTFEMSATKKSGETVSDRATLAIAVGNVDPSTVVPGDGNPAPGPSATSTTTTTTTAAAANTGGGLARTGPGSALPLAIAGIALVGTGGALLMVLRRRRSADRAL